LPAFFYFFIDFFFIHPLKEFNLDKVLLIVDKREIKSS